MIPGESCAGNDAVHMDMVKQLLVPCVEYLDDTGGCAEELFIRGKFQKGFSAAFMEEAIKKFLVTVDEGVEFMGQGKNDMEVRGIDDFGPATIDPAFFLYSLAVRAVTVFAGIIVYF